jgi:Bacterial Death-like domain 1/Effector-associated domain 2
MSGQQRTNAANPSEVQRVQAGGNDIAALHSNAAATKPRVSGARGLDQALLSALAQALMQCDEFQTTARLRAAFGVEELRIWQTGLPETDNLRARVDLTIAYLREKRRRSGEYALVLLLTVLVGRYDPEDQRHPLLADLASQLQARLDDTTPHPVPPSTPASPTDTTSKDKPVDAGLGVSGTTTSQQEDTDRQADPLAATLRLRGHLYATKQLLADPDLRPQDCDTAISNLDAAQQAVQEIHELLSAPSSEPKLSAAASEFQALRHSLNLSIQQLKTDLSQLRNSCPPTQPAAQQRRVALHSSSTQLLRWLAVFEGALSPGPVFTSAPSPDPSAPTKNVVSTEPVPTPASDPPPALQKFDSIQLAKLLSDVRALNTNQDRTHIIGSLKNKLKIAAMPRHNSNDLFDIHEIVTTCVQYDNGLGHLIKILREIDNDSLPLRKVTEYLVACKIPFELT